MEARKAPEVLPRRGFRHSMASIRAGRRRGSRVSLIVAFAANLLVAAAKLAAGLITGSAALLAEAAHSGGGFHQRDPPRSLVSPSATPARRRAPIRLWRSAVPLGLPRGHLLVSDRRLLVGRAGNQRPGARQRSRRLRRRLDRPRHRGDCGRQCVGPDHEAGAPRGSRLGRVDRPLPAGNERSHAARPRVRGHRGVCSG